MEKLLWRKWLGARAEITILQWFHLTQKASIMAESKQQALNELNFSLFSGKSQELLTRIFDFIDSDSKD